METYHKKLIKRLLKDPLAGPHIKSYAKANLEGMFLDLIKKEGSVLERILFSIEIRLDR